MKFPEHTGLDLFEINRQVLQNWDALDLFHRSITERQDAEPFIFYEGPPSANGHPGIHHVMARTIKDVICRYQTMTGHLVRRKAGWDTHGLPVELAVEKALGITKEDIGRKVSVEEYNARCRQNVMTYTEEWRHLSRLMGYWVDMEHPYITYDNAYIETLWWLLSALYKKGLLYKGYTIQPYSPAAGTGLSSHELNQPGCYRKVKDTTVTALFRVLSDEEGVISSELSGYQVMAGASGGAPSDAKANNLLTSKLRTNNSPEPLYLAAWTTTPWTLPSNTALCVGPDIDYVLVRALHPYTHQPIHVILAEARVNAYFKTEGEDANAEILLHMKGKDLVGLHYEQLMPWIVPVKRVMSYELEGYQVTAGASGDGAEAPLQGADLNGNSTPGVETPGCNNSPFQGSEANNLIAEANNLLTSKLKTDNSLFEVAGKQFVTAGDEAFRVIAGDYVTTDDGTGIVHIAPTFGADDARVARAAGIPSLYVITKDGETRPMVDLTGKYFRREDMAEPFVQHCVDIEAYAAHEGEYVKNEFIPEEVMSSELEGYQVMPSGSENAEANNLITSKLRTNNSSEDLNIRLCMEMKAAGTALKIEKHEHDYPHCWRTDKPVIYYPLDSWFIRSSALKERMAELNRSIRWKPTSTGTGRFHGWLENLNDWNLSRSRYWGTPLPIWRNKDSHEEMCIDSLATLYAEIEKSVQAGFMTANPLKEKGFVPGDYSHENYARIDLHRPYVDDIILCSPTGKPMRREADLIDVWFDSGAMPYAQLHYPFENREMVDDGTFFPAHFIAEGVDQTRGWFFTLHAIATMVFDSVAFRSVISNGLVLDKYGQKMSKRLGNAVDPFQTIEKYGADPVRWYMMTNSAPWDNLKFDEDGVMETSRAFFSKLYQTYAFFALYANIEDFEPSEEEHRMSNSLDRWILSELQTLIKDVRAAYDDLEPTRAGRLIQSFVIDNLSNWHVRLSRKRFWQGEREAMQTLYTCLLTVAKLMAPIAPFFADRLYRDLTQGRHGADSVHLCLMPEASEALCDDTLQRQMRLAQKVTTLALSIRKKERIIVRQPLGQIAVPLTSPTLQGDLEAVGSLILDEINVKELVFIPSDRIEKQVKCNFRVMGKKFGKQMKAVAAAVAALTPAAIASLEADGTLDLPVDGGSVTIERDDVEIHSTGMPGWSVASEGALTVALDLTITPELRAEGYVREIVKRIQTYRKESGFEITDRIRIAVLEEDGVLAGTDEQRAYLMQQVLATEVSLVKALPQTADVIELPLDSVTLHITVEKSIA